MKVFLSRIFGIPFFTAFVFFSWPTEAIQFGFLYDYRLDEPSKRILGDAAGKLSRAIITEYPKHPRDQKFDVVITVKLQSIDGEGGTLAQASPTKFVTYNHDGGQYVSAGTLEIDSADLRNLGLLNIVTHEICHILGFGTLWEEYKLVNTSASGEQYFIGTHAAQAYTNLRGRQGLRDNRLWSVPLESGGGPGTIGAHWSEKEFYNELMTGYYNENMTNPLSSVTLASFVDLGHKVDYNYADPYQLPRTINSGALIGAGVGQYNFNRKPYHNCTHHVKYEPYVCGAECVIQ